MTSLWQLLFRPLVDFAATLDCDEKPLPRAPANLVIRPTTRDEAIERALAWVGRKSRYRLGGGAHVDAEHPFARDGTCDCSGFTGHVTGHNRIQRIEGKRHSFYTDNAIRDAYEHRRSWIMRGGVVGAGPEHLYRGVDDDDVLGCLIVRPGRYAKIGRSWKRVKIGHVGIITAVDPGFIQGAPDWWRMLKVVHCTPNRGRPSAVRMTDARAWRRRAYFCRPRWYA